MINLQFFHYTLKYCRAQDLVDELKSELEGNLEKVVVALMLTNSQLYAKELRDSFVGLGTDDKAVAEILGPLDNKEMKEISSVYQKGKRFNFNINEIKLFEIIHYVPQSTELR